MHLHHDRLHINACQSPQCIRYLGESSFQKHKMQTVVRTECTVRHSCVMSYMAYRFFISRLCYEY